MMASSPVIASWNGPIIARPGLVDPAPIADLTQT
jgi:hypothetical protein